MAGGFTSVVEPLTPLLGRSAALERLEALLDGERPLVSLIGPPGIGKTRLALALAARREAGRDPRRVLFCDLDSVHSRSELCARVGAALGGELDASPDPAPSVARQLAAAGDRLLVLDNAEHLADTVAELAAGWLRAATGLRCLVTSRERLRIAGETAYELDALSEPSALELFVARAREARDGALRDPDELATATEIVLLLEGVPLALELAAAQLVALSPAALLARLQQPLALLDAGFRGASARHASLRAAIDASWRLLDEAQRTVLAQSAVFRGSFTLQAAEAVLRASAERAQNERVPSLPNVLRQLRDHSLLCMRDDAFWLPIALREYAQEQLEQRGDRQAVFARHARHYLAATRPGAGVRARGLADGAAGAAHGTRDNLHAVVARGLEATDGSAKRAANGTHSGVTHAQALAALCLLAEDASDVPALLALFDRALDGGARPDTDHVEHPDHGENLAGEVQARLARGRLRLRTGRAAAALEDFDAVLASTCDVRFHAAACCGAGNAQRQLGRHALAERAYEQALAHHVQQGDRDSEAALLASLGGMFFEQREIARARALHDRALALYRELGNERGAAVVLQNTGLILQEQGQLLEAEVVFREAHRLQIALGNRRFEAIALFDLAGLCFERGLWSKALEWAEQALELLRAQGDRRQAALCLGLRGACAAALGRLAAARADLDRAERELDALGDRVYGRALSVHRGHLELAHALRAYGDGADAEHGALLAQTRARIAARFSGGAAAPTRRRARAHDPGLPDSDEHRLAVRVLRAALGRHRELERSLLVASDQSWLRGPSARRSPLSSKKVLRRILAALVERRLRAATTPLSAAELVQRGWPNERLAARAAGNRLQVALAELRKRGLARVLARNAEGYLLDPKVPLFVIDGS